MNRFEHGGGAAGGIDGAVDPGVAVIAPHHPLVGVLRSFELADDIPNDAALEVLHGDQVDLHAALSSKLSEVVAEGQGALPLLRHTGAAEGLQDRRGVVVAEGNRDNVRLVAVGRYARRVRSEE